MSRFHFAGQMIYPALIAVTSIVSRYAASTVPLESAVRPLVAAAVFALLLHCLVSTALRSIERGAIVASSIAALVMGVPILALALSGGAALAMVAAHRSGLGVRDQPWARMSQSTSLVAGITTVLVIGNAIAAGAITFARQDWVARGAESPGLPDIYLIMFDGYPRSDTLASKLHLDDRPFLADMESLGFDVAKRSHSNYNTTVLSVASLISGNQIPVQVPHPPPSVPAQYRVLSQLINAGSAFRPFRDVGYEVVSIPSAYSDAALLSGDRVVDHGHLTFFEMNVLASGVLRPVVGSPIWDSHRSRIMDTFETFSSLAAERGRPPKVVYAHLMVPHPPVVFDRDGEAVAPAPCYPAHCPMLVLGDAPGPDSSIEPVRDQILWVESEIERIARAIQERSTLPPVIIVFSDHGLRNDPTDIDETFRSFFMASTPAHPALFPEDTTPVTILARLASAYTPTSVPLASEESYLGDLTRTDGDVLSTLRRVHTD